MVKCGTPGISFMLTLIQFSSNFHNIFAETELIKNSWTAYLWAAIHQTGGYVICSEIFWMTSSWIECKNCWIRPNLSQITNGRLVCHQINSLNVVNSQIKRIQCWVHTFTFGLFLFSICRSDNSFVFWHKWVYWIANVDNIRWNCLWKIAWNRKTHRLSLSP